MNYDRLRRFTMEKEAAAPSAEVADARENLSGIAASTLGRVNPNTLIGAAALAPTAPIRHLRGLTAAQARHITEAAQEDFGDDLGGVKVRVGGGDVIDDLKRVATSKDLYLPEKAIGVLGTLTTAPGAALGRADHFNPYSNTIQTYSGDPAVLAHELGHAADFNRFQRESKGKGSLYRNSRQLSSMAGRAAAGLSGAAKATLGAAGAAAAQPMTLLTEARATDNALKGQALRKAMAAQYGTDEAGATEQARNILVPAYGSYLGGAAGAGLGLAAALKGRKPSKAMALAPLAGMGLGHLAARGYNAATREKKASLSEKVAQIRQPTLAKLASAIQDNWEGTKEAFSLS